MPKKKGKNKQSSKTARSARDIQTPFSDRENSTHITNSKSPSPGPSTRRRYKVSRSPTREGDFAPGASGDDLESNDATDPELENASEQEAPVEHKRASVGRWVKEVIRNETQKQSVSMTESFFTCDEPQYDRCQEFFQRLNQQIRAANDANDASDLDRGIIPERGYVDLCQTWRQEFSKAKETGSASEGWELFHKTRHLLKLFNRRHYLPQEWNISRAWAENFIGTPDHQIDVDSDIATLSTSDEEPLNQASQAVESEESSTESRLGQEDNQPTGLDALEARTTQQQRRLTSAKVLYWWPKGTGSQIFVRYGDRSTPIYRIRAGSHESYNPSRVERVLMTKTRGTAKVIGTKNGLPEEYWKYDRKHVDDLVGVGWKVEEDDENGIDALSLLRPEKGAVYPQTRTLVKWKDGTFTLEGRTFIRRITSGSSLDGDRVLYQKAQEMESTYRKKHGLDEVSDGESDDDFMEDDRTSRRTRRRARFEETSEDSDSASDDSVRPDQSHKDYRKKISRRSSHHPTPPAREKAKYRRSTMEDDRIRKLEQELRNLKMGGKGRAKRHSRAT